ncbi:MAG: FAD-dependent oxidoreductase [Candidatus Saccharibacteria bacterium]
MKLFTPIKIRNMELRNRIVMAAMHLGYADEGYVTERFVRFYEERSKGGAGLIMVGGIDIDEHAYATMLSVSDDKYISGLQELTSRVQKYGAKVGCQLFQAGRYSFSILTGHQAVSASETFSPLTREKARALTTEQTYEMIKTFGEGARRAREAGFDMVEIICSAGYLIGQFLSPLTNLRTDEFGGSLENRMRFGLEVVKEVRRQVGQDYPIGVRFPGNELMPGGTPAHELLTFAREIEQAGADMINVTGGWHESNVPQITMNVPNGAFVYMAQAVKQAVTIPVAASNRINDPLLAEKILLNGQADLVTIARGLLADPELPRKAQEGRFKEIRKCVACNQGCMDHVFEGRIVECLVNAEAGHECEVEVRPSTDKKKILVIGGGPAGMEAARVAATRGHTVSLWEASNRLGGQLHLASAPPGRGDFLLLNDYLTESLRVLGVDVFIGKTANTDTINALKPDVIIIATGAEPITPPIPGADKKIVVQAWDLLSEDMELGNSIVIIGGGATGAETALHLANVGTIDAETLRFLMTHKVETSERLHKLITHGIKNITVIEQRPKIGMDIGRSTKWVISIDLPAFGVNVMTSTKVISIEDDGVIVERDGQQSKINADMVVMAVGSRSVNGLNEQLKDSGAEVHLIGDAQKPRKIMDAIHEGFHAGNRI